MREPGQRWLWWRHVISVLLAPVTMTLVIPAIIGISTAVRAPHLTTPLTAVLAILGALLIAGGLALLIWTGFLFDRVGQGALGVGPVLEEPVNPVLRGPYGHVRNPMISGVLCILHGQAPRPEISAHHCRTRSGHVIPTRAARKVAHVRP